MQSEALKLHTTTLEAMQSIQGQWYIAFNKVSEVVAQLAKEGNDEELLKELADWMYVLRETSGLLDAFRKVVDRIREDFEKLYVQKVQIQLTEDAESVRPTVRTDYCTCSVKVTHRLPFPTAKADPEGYKLFMKSIGVPDHLVENEAVMPTYEGFPKYLESLFSKGLPLPNNIDPTKHYVLLSTTIRKRKGLLENVD